MIAQLTMAMVLGGMVKLPHAQAQAQAPITRPAPPLAVVANGHCLMCTWPLAITKAFCCNACEQDYRAGHVMQPRPTFPTTTERLR